MSKAQIQRPVAEPVIDAIVGMSDGLVVPFALATAISRITTNNIVVIGWVLAAIIVGAVAMGFGSYYAAKQEDAHDEEKEQLLYKKLELEAEIVNAISEEARQDKENWESLTARYDMPVEFHAGHARTSGLNIAIAYAVGGLIPLTPYFFLSTVEGGLKLSLVVTAFCLLLFGFLKARYTSQNAMASAFRYILT